MGNTLGEITGVETSIADHDKVMQYMHQKMHPDNLMVFVTLPAGLGLTVGESKKELKVYKKNGFKIFTIYRCCCVYLKELGQSRLFW